MRYIGLDIGDGESAVALLEENSVIEPVICPISGANSIISVVGMAGTEVRIGEQALMDHQVVHLRSRFKSRYLTAPDAEKDIERFAFGIRQELEKENPGLFSDDTYVTVGCPAGWNAQQREHYRSLMVKAGFGEVHIVSESRAAFFYARYSHSLNVPAELLCKTTLVIDIGSSTTDFAYIVNGRESDVGTFGDVSLGGGLIEACMLKKAVRHSADRDKIEAVFAESSSWKNRCEIKARRLKEQYFLDEARWVNSPCVATETLYYDDPVKLRIELNEDIMREIISTPMQELGGATFAECLSDLLRHAENCTRENPPELLILTGGASRMAFFREACAREFPDARVIVCPEPEFSIAKGLAYAGRVDKRLGDFYADIDAFFADGTIESAVQSSLDWLTQPMASALSGRIISDVVMNVLDRWKSGEIRTINDMNTPIVNGTAALLSDPEALPELKPVIADWCRRLFTVLQPRIDDICRAHNVDRASMALSAVHSVTSPESMNILLESRFATALTYVITAALSAALCGGTGAALLAEGPLGILVGALIGIVVGYVGKKAVANTLKAKELPKFVRSLAAAGFKNSVRSAKQRKIIEDELVRALQKPEFLSQLTSDVTASLKSQIIDMARSVEMPIVQ